MGQHAFLAPSSAHIWGPPDGCRAYPVIAAGFPRENDCDESDEGTACHEWAAGAVAAWQSSTPFPELEGERALNGVMFDSDMRDAAAIYADYVAGVCRERGSSAVILEQRLDCPRVHPEHNGGTPDGYLWAPPYLEIFDFKYGFGVVEAFENWQCLNYARAVLDSLGTDGGEETFIKVTLHVVQPRAPHPEGPCRSWSLRGGALRGYSNILQTSGAECFEPDPIARTGPHCRDCEGRTVCTALHNDAASAADFATRSPPQVLGIRDAETELVVLDDALRALQHRRDGLAEVVEHAARRGEPVRYYAMERKQARKKWLFPDADVFALGDEYGVELRKIQPITPTQAEKAGIDAGVINAYAQRPAGGLELKRDTGQKARKIFGGQHHGTN